MRDRLHEQAGYVVVTAMCVMLVGLLLGAAAVGSAVSTEAGVRRDAESRVSVQVARAGLETALARTELLVDSGADARTTCPGGVVAGTQQASTLVGNWCTYAGASGASPFTAEEAGVSGRFRFAVSGNVGTTRFERMIVVEGTVDGVTRRVAQRLSAADLWEEFAPYAVASDEPLVMDNNAALGDPVIVTSARSNGSITLEGTARICGNAIPGPGSTVTTKNGGYVCDGYSKTPATTRLTFPPVTVPAANDNASICPGGSNGSCPGFGNWEVTYLNGQLTVGNSAALTIRGNVFSLCRLYLTNAGRLNVIPTDASLPVRIYLRPPEQCGGVTEPLKFDNNPLLTVQGSTLPVQFYVAGSPTTATNVNFSNFDQQMRVQVYAPRSAAKLDNNVKIVGGMIARNVRLVGGTRIDALNGAPAMDLGTSQSLKRGPFTECTGRATALNPGAGC